MNRRAAIAAVLGVALFGGAAGYRVLRGSSGQVASTSPVPEFTTMEPTRWANGAPTSLASAKGDVLLIEGWSPG